MPSAKTKREKKTSAMVTGLSAAPCALVAVFDSNDGAIQDRGKTEEATNKFPFRTECCGDTGKQLGAAA
jgi:hypothetical protein